MHHGRLPSIKQQIRFRAGGRKWGAYAGLVHGMLPADDPRASPAPLTPTPTVLLRLRCASFGLVPIPLEMRLYLVGGLAAVAASTYAWEHSLRSLLPAGRPPAKGYLVHKAELEAAKAAKARAKKGA